MIGFDDGGSRASGMRVMLIQRRDRASRMHGPRHHMKQTSQPNLFGESDDRDDATPSRIVLPEGFKYQPNVIAPAEERELIRNIEPLPFKEFEFHGFTGKRRVVSFGWRYDFGERDLQRAS